MNDFVTGHLTFWLITYTLALTAWACLGRFLMQAFVPEDSPNYIWRGFRLLTGWAIGAVRYLVPTYVTQRFLPLVAAFWLFGLRLVFGLLMLSVGMAPRVGGGG